jgi:hypothetical protein
MPAESQGLILEEGRGVTIPATAYFGHPSPSKRRNHATDHAYCAPAVLRSPALQPGPGQAVYRALK